MNPQIEIKYSTAVAKAKQMLSVYAKRSKDKQGNMMFQDFTFSAAEELACKTYIQIAVNDIISDVLQFVQGVTTDADGISFRARNTRWQSDTDEDFQSALVSHIYNFASLFAVMKILAAIAPALTKEVADDANAVKRDIHGMFFFKYAPGASGKGPDDVTGIVAPT
jgi:hypothetical protein